MTTPGWFQQNQPPNVTPGLPAPANPGAPGATTSPFSALTPTGAQPTSTTQTTPGSTGGTPFPNAGGGWNQFATSPGTPQYALQQAFAQGLTGQAAVDAANSSLGLQPPNSISYGSDGTYGLPNGYYVAPNAANNGALDLISRGGSSGGTSGGSTSSQLQSLENTPGYQFTLQQGEQGVQRSAAANGTLLTGGTLKALAGYDAGLASQTYQNAVNNALGLYQTGLNAVNDTTQ